MVQLNGVRFDRCLMPPNAVGQAVLCFFSDASEDAFGACAYGVPEVSMHSSLRPSQGHNEETDHTPFGASRFNWARPFLKKSWLKFE